MKKIILLMIILMVFVSSCDDSLIGQEKCRKENKDEIIELYKHCLESPPVNARSDWSRLCKQDAQDLIC